MRLLSVKTRAYSSGLFYCYELARKQSRFKSQPDNKGKDLISHFLETKGFEDAFFSAIFLNNQNEKTRTPKESHKLTYIKSPLDCHEFESQGINNSDLRIIKNTELAYLQLKLSILVWNFETNILNT